jgi:hypothetical protein
MNTAADIGKDIGSMLSNKDLTDNLTKLGQGLFGGNPQEQQYYESTGNPMYADNNTTF